MADLRVYYEKQGADKLCGVHCLNSLVQGPAFNQSDLNKLAAELDKEEAALLAADPTQQKAPRSMTISSLANRPGSHNVDDTGNFSLGVLEKALRSRFGLTVENAARKDIIQSINRDGLEGHEGFVVNLREHWFCARAFPNYPGVREWYFLDSLKTGPLAVTENELWGTLQGIIQSGGNVFVLRGGKLPAAGTKPAILRANQYFLSREDIKKGIGSDAGGSTSAAFTVQKKEAAVVKTDWTKMGAGNSLKETADGIKSEPKEKKLREFRDLKPEPSLTVSVNRVAALLVRLPSGERHMRRFDLHEDLVDDVNSWVESLCGASVYSLIARGWKLEKVSESSYRVGGGSERKEVKGSDSLGSAGIASGQEAFNLQLYFFFCFFFPKSKK